MAKKDYELIAGAIYGARVELQGRADAGREATPRIAVAVVIEHVAAALAREGARFDRGRFIAACETGRGTR